MGNNKDALTGIQGAKKAGVHMPYTIAQATEAHLTTLQVVEREAATLFEGHNIPPHIIEEVTPLEELRQAMQTGYLWVALDEAGEPVGFALTEPLKESLHLEELAVTPAHGRRGLGRALVEAVCHAARSRGFSAVTLTTFRDLPWNAPFYQKFGFAVIPPEALPPTLQAIMEKEARRGLTPDRRVAMRRSVGA